MKATITTFLSCICLLAGITVKAQSDSTGQVNVGRISMPSAQQGRIYYGLNDKSDNLTCILYTDSSKHEVIYMMLNGNKERLKESKRNTYQNSNYTVSIVADAKKENATGEITVTDLNGNSVSVPYDHMQNMGEASK